MSGKPRSAPVALTTDEPLPLEVLAGNGAVLTVRVYPDQPGRAGRSINVTGPQGEAASYVFVADLDGRGTAAAVTLNPSPQLGEHMFRLALPSHEIDGTLYDEATLQIPVRVMPQPTSLAVWDVPTAIVVGAAFTVKVGAKSAAGTGLAGCAVEVLDEAGDIVGSGNLGDVPLAGTVALYWCDTELTAPCREGLANFVVRFSADSVDLPHRASTTSFSVATVRPPEHVLSVKVVEHETCAPIADVELRLGAYRGVTSESGLAQIAIPKGSYELHLWKVGFEASSHAVEIGGDAFVEIAAKAVPEEDPDARWRM